MAERSTAAAAKASVRTIPKLSPRARGAEQVASCREVQRLSPENAPAHVDRAHGFGVGQIAKHVLALCGDGS